MDDGIMDGCMVKKPKIKHYNIHMKVAFMR